MKAWQIEGNLADLCLTTGRHPDRCRGWISFTDGDRIANWEGEMSVSASGIELHGHRDPEKFVRERDVLALEVTFIPWASDTPCTIRCVNSAEPNVSMRQLAALPARTS